MTDSQFSRARPTPQYHALLKHYGQMHSEGYAVDDHGNARQLSAAQAFPGNELPKFIGPIKQLIDKHKARTILDYGSGKGKQYGPAKVQTPDGKTYDSIGAYWGVERITCFDPGVAEFSKLPTEKSDGVVSTDVLEHCYAGDVPWIVREMFSLAAKFVFCNIACYPAMAKLPTGENAHCTQRDPQWWEGLFTGIANEFAGVDFVLCCIAPATNAEGKTGLQPVWLQKPKY